MRQSEALPSHARRGDYLTARETRSALWPFARLTPVSSSRLRCGPAIRAESREAARTSEGAAALHTSKLAGYLGAGKDPRHGVSPLAQGASQTQVQTPRFRIQMRFAAQTRPPRPSCRCAGVPPSWKSIGEGMASSRQRLHYFAQTAHILYPQE